jgi:hypothetical protein
MNVLLDKATAQLELNSPLAVRRACWLARAALEELIVDMLAAKGVNCANASERSKLSCLEGAYATNRRVVFRTEFAWNRLSEACHQHAYQLAPTNSEAIHLIALVTSLVDAKEWS